MAKFKFRLQSYLNIKEKLEDQKKMEYGIAASLVEEEKYKKQKIIDNRINTVVEFKNNVSGAVKPLEVARYNNYIKLLKKREKEQEIVVEKAKEKAEEKRVMLVEAMKERKMLETLKDKDFAEYITEEKRNEQKATDEVVSYRFNKPKN